MNSYIEECKFHGVIHPRIVVHGWFEAANSKLLFKSKNGEILYTNEYNNQKVKKNHFLIDIPVYKHRRFKLVVESVDGNIELANISTNLLKRLYDRVKPIKAKYIMFKDRREKRSSHYLDMKNIDTYNQWLKKHETITDVLNHEYNPLISIVMPVYNVKREYLSDCIDSILAQTYENFEICIADDHSTREETIQTLKEYMKKDKRIKVIFRNENGHISEATNTALTLSSGEFIALMDNDDMLLPHSLNEVVYVLNQNRNIDFLYSDEDKVNLEGQRCDPHFKSDFCLDSLFGGNYCCHLSVIRKSLIDKIGGFRKGYEGAQDFDLFLRISKETEHIYHIPKILYHWRMIEGSTALASESKNYAGEKGRLALQDYFNSKNIPVNIETVVNTHYFIQYLYDNEPEVSIIIRMYEDLEILKKCLKSLIKRTMYETYDIHIILESVSILDINIIQKSLKGLNARINVIKESELTDDYLANSCGEYIVFYDSNNSIITGDWLTQIVGYAMQDRSGVIGTKIIDSNNLVKECVYILNEKIIGTKAFVPSYDFDYGCYGRTLVPHNYSVVSTLCCIIEKKKLLQAEKFNNKFSVFANLFSLCLNMQLLGYKNIFVPEIKVKNKGSLQLIEFSNEDKKWIAEKWRNAMKNDDNYNRNMSTNYPYSLK